MTKKEIRDITSIRLKEFRVEKGFTQEQLAEALELPRPTIAMIETKVMGVSKRVNTKLAEVFGIDILETVYQSLQGYKAAAKKECKYCPYCGGNLKQVNFYQ